MRIITLLMLTITIKAYAGADIAPLETVPFEGVQYECRQVGGISFGANGRWADCHVTRGRWVATIDFLDIYQAQYCLGNTPESCEQTAQVIFANRAYTPDATVLLTRLDEAGTSYIDPLIVNSDNDSVMSMTSRNVQVWSPRNISFGALIIGLKWMHNTGSTICKQGYQKAHLHVNYLRCLI